MSLKIKLDCKAKSIKESITLKRKNQVCKEEPYQKEN
jgi:hypothetical protein